MLNPRVPFDSETGECKLWMSYGGRSGVHGLVGLDISEGQLGEDFSGREWRVQVLRPDEVGDQTGSQSGASRPSDNDRELAILRHLATLTGGATKSAIASATCMSVPKCEERLRSLEASQRVNQEEINIHGRTQTGWRIAEPGHRLLARYNSESGAE